MKSIRERKFNFIENQNDDVKIFRDYWNWKFRKEFFAKNRIRLINIKHVLNEIDLTIDDIRKIFTKNSKLQQWTLKKHLFIDQIMRFDEKFKKFKFRLAVYGSPISVNGLPYTENFPEAPPATFRPISPAKVRFCHTKVTFLLEMPHSNPSTICLSIYPPTLLPPHLSVSSPPYFPL